MKASKFRKLIQKPLRFHHQDIHEELEDIRNDIKYIKYSLQSLQHGIDQLIEKSELRMPKSGNDLW